MINNEFETELREYDSNNSSTYAEDYLDFVNYQCDNIRCLKEIGYLFEKNEITYTLAYGSLLGAIRDNGQIPWDYDIDIIVPYEQRAKVIEILNQSMSDEFYYACRENRLLDDISTIRICPQKYESDCLHLDIFFAIGLPEKENGKYIRKIDEICKAYSYKYTDANRISFGNRARYEKYMLGKIKYLTTSYKRIMNQEKKYFSKYNCKESKSLLLLPVDYSLIYRENKNECYYSSYLFDREKVHTSIGDYFCPKKYDEVLTFIYGDYHKTPPLSQRISEFQYTYHRINEYGIRDCSNLQTFVDETGIKDMAVFAYRFLLKITKKNYKNFKRKVYNFLHKKC